MKISRFFATVLISGLLCLCFWTAVSAQQSGSSASESRSCAIPPKVEQAVTMDTRWGSSVISPSQREAVLQIGFTTAEVNKRIEVQSHISSVAKNVELTIEYGAGLRLEKIYGYQPRHSKGNASITLDDMNNGLTQVVMAKFRADSITSLPVKVRLSYHDVKRNRPVVVEKELSLWPADNESCELLMDVVVKKNYTIAQLADALLEMTGLARRGDYARAQRVLDSSLAGAYQRYSHIEDAEIKFIMNIVEGYQRDLKVYNGYHRKSDCRGSR